MPSPLLIRQRLKIGLISFAMYTAAHISTASAEVWVVTDRNHPVQVPQQARLILLDDSETLEAKLSEGLPTNAQQALSVIQQRLRTPDAQRLQRDLAVVQQGLVDAWSLGVTKLPAVVVDRQFVVYGETDVLAAVQRIEKAGIGRP